MGLDVIGVGYGRTGTETLRDALEILGFGPCHHMHVMRDHPETYDPWRTFDNPETADWPKLYAGFRSAVDFPTVAYWRELAEYYPDAKIVMTTRDAEQWYDSATASVLKLLAEKDQIKDPHHKEILAFSDKFVGNLYFEGRGPDRDYMINRFHQHENDVRQEIAADRLLVYRVSDGWDPLCAFLGTGIPAQPFPFANTKGQYREAWD